MNIQPLHDGVLLQKAKKEKKTKEGIVIPDTTREKPVEGTTIAVRKGKTLENGDIKSLEVKKGDRVLFGKHSGTEISLEGEDYFVIREENIFEIIY